MQVKKNEEKRRWPLDGLNLIEREIFLLYSVMLQYRKRYNMFGIKLIKFMRFTLRVCSIIAGDYIITIYWYVAFSQLMKFIIAWQINFDGKHNNEEVVLYCGPDMNSVWGKSIACFRSGTNIIIGNFFHGTPQKTSFPLVDFYYISEYEFSLVSSKSVVNFK